MLKKIETLIEANEFFSEGEIEEANHNGLSLYDLACLYFRQERPNSKVVKQGDKVVIYAERLANNPG